MSDGLRTPEWIFSNKVRVGVAIAAGLIAGVFGTQLRIGSTGPLIGWDAGALTYTLWVLVATLRLGSSETARIASREDAARLPMDLALLVASVLALVGVGVTLAGSGDKGPGKTLIVLIAVGSVVASWLLVHTIYMLLYARLYYHEQTRGIDFHSKEDPEYGDFAYMAFTVGMTFQVSDTDISSRKIRRAVLHHAGLSYLFGTVFVATTINLIAGLGSK